MIVNMTMTQDDFYDIESVNDGETVALHLFYKDDDNIEHEIIVTALHEDKDD